MKLRCAGAVALTGLTLGGSARADDTTELQSLLSEQVITTASTTAQRASAAPALSTTITADDLQLYGFRTLAEAINFLSLGVVTSSPLRAPDIGSRGVLFGNDDGKHFLLLVNGHAINDPLYGAARFDQGTGIPLDLVDHIEVIVGPGSVLYGSNAMMGVINVITKSAFDYNGVHVLTEWEPGASVRAAAGAGFTFKLFGTLSEITAGADYYQRFGPSFEFPIETFPNTPGGPFNTKLGPTEPATNIWGGTLSRANFTQVPSGMLRFRSGDVEVNLLASAYRRSTPYATSQAATTFDDPGNYQLERALRLDIRHQATLSQLVQLTSRVYADSFDRQQRDNIPGLLLFRTVPTVEYYDAGVARWAGVEERLSLNWLHDQSLVTLLGVDARERWASAKEDILDATTGRYIGPTEGHIDTSASLIAPYVQQTYSPTRWIDFNVGSRLDADSRFSPVLSPRAAVAVRPWDKTTVKADYSQAFRAPTWSETSLANYEVAPSDVKPETVRSIEASIEQRFSTQRLVFGVFHTWWDDLIESTALSADNRTVLQMQGRLPRVVSSLAQFQNLASLNNYGWNGGWEGSLAGTRLRYGANATGAYARQTENGVSAPLAVAPQIFGNMRIAYVFDGYAPTPALAVAFAGPRPADRLSPIGATLPEAPPRADFRLTLNGRVPAIEGLSYRASVDYVTAAHGPYTAGPDGSYIGSATTRATYLALPTPDFVPIDQFRAFVGLRYDVGAGSRTTAQGEVP